MTNQPPPLPGQDTIPVCPRHPDRESYVRCQRCNRPTCPECQRPAAVGIQCVDCVREGAKSVRTARTPFGGTQTAGGRNATTVIVGLCVAVYVGQLTVSGLTGALGFSPHLGWSEPWRFLTASFVHASSGGMVIAHIAFNMLALWMIGPYLEGLLGRLRFVLLYLISAVGSSVLVLVLARTPPNDPSQITRDYLDWFTLTVGASGAVFGLFGAILVLNRELGRSSAWLYGTLGINAVFGFIVPGISWQGHLGGLLTGAAAAAVLAALRTPERRRWQLPALGLVVVLLAVVVVVKYAGVIPGLK